MRVRAVLASAAVAVGAIGVAAYGMNTTDTGTAPVGSEYQFGGATLTDTVPLTVADPLAPDGLLSQLVISAEDRTAPYSRDQWDDGWDYHGRGCNTRELVLEAHGTGVERGKGCEPVCPRGGCWLSPYDQKRASHRDELQIEHVVPLAEAARSKVLSATGNTVGRGAGWEWTWERKEAFSEDQRHLLPLTSAVNQDKKDKDPGDWRPPARKAWCEYATIYAQTKVRWELSADQAEWDALAAMLATC